MSGHVTLLNEIDIHKKNLAVKCAVIEKLEQELADTKKKLEDLESGSKGACFACEPVGIKNKQLEAFKKEALDIINQLAQSPHPYTIHERRDDLEHRFGLQIEVARAFLQKHTTKMEG